MPDPLVYVLVITWNGRDHLRACFESLLASDYPNVEFVLIDNNSTDGSVALVAELFAEDCRVQVIENGENLGWSRGNNVGLERALDKRADYVLLLNDDTAIAPDAISKLVAMAEADPTIGSLAPKMILFDQPDILNSVGMECSIIGSCWDRGLGRIDTGDWDSRIEVIGACGGAAFFRSSTLEKTGLLPTDFDIYLDDLDLSLRIWDAGFRIQTCPDAIVRHKFSATMGVGDRAKRKYYLNTRNRIRVMQRHVPLRYVPRVAVALLHGECKAIGRALLDGNSWIVGAHARAWAAAFRYLPSMFEARAEIQHTGGSSCPWWRLLTRKPLFFPGVELPKDGWYAERNVDSTRLRPIARTARLETKRGRLRIIHANGYPRIGATDVRLVQNGQQIAALSTNHRDETIVDLEPGTLTFQAEKIFRAEDTHEPIDIGGWLAVEWIS